MDATAQYAPTASPGWRPGDPTVAFPSPVAGKFPTPTSTSTKPASPRRFGMGVTIVMLIVAAGLGSLIAVFVPKLLR